MGPAAAGAAGFGAGADGAGTGWDDTTFEEIARGGVAGGAATRATAAGGAGGAACADAEGVPLAGTDDEPLTGAGADAVYRAYSAMNDFNAPKDAT